MAAALMSAWVPLLGAFVVLVLMLLVKLVAVVVVVVVAFAGAQQDYTSDIDIGSINSCKPTQADTIQKHLLKKRYCAA